MTGHDRQSDFLLAGVSNLLVPVATFATAPLLAHGLGVDGRGEVAAATAPLVLLLSAMTLGLPEALTYWVANRGSVARRIVPWVCGLAGGIGLLGILVVLVSSEALSSGSPSLRTAMLLSTTVLPLGLVTAALRGFAIGAGAWKLVVAERATSALARLAGLILLLLTGRLDVLSASVVLAGSYGLAVVPYAALLIRQRTTPRSSSEIRPMEELRGLSLFGVSIWAGTISGIILSRLDQVILAPLSSVYELGLYAAAVNIAEVVLVLNNSVRDVMFARLSRAFDDASVGKVARIATLLCVLPTAGILLLGYPLLKVLFGVGFTAAYPPLAIVVVALWAGCAGSIAGAALNAGGRPIRRSVSLVAGAVVNLVALVLLAPSLGALGAALATCAGSVVAANLNILLLRSRGLRFMDFYVPRASDLRSIVAILRKQVRGMGARRRVSP